jgi:putative YhdH/YhfP family quinone oxidoreductase
MTEFQQWQVSTEPEFHAELVKNNTDNFPTDTVTVKVSYAGINYKDALAFHPKTGVLRSYPMTPGIDLVGEVTKSPDGKFPIGTKVIGTSYGIGVSLSGGFSEYQSIPADWLVPLPAPLSEKEAMVIGTAGLTAGMAVEALEKHGLNTQSKVLVTGATGGVGSFALAILQQLGIANVTALSRKEEATDYLASLGAKALAPSALFPEKTRPLDKQLFDYVIDTVGGDQLTQILPLLSYGGSVALCGNAGGVKFSTTVLPFILRGVNLLGIDSAEYPMAQRVALWQRFATDWRVTEELAVTEVALPDVLSATESLLNGTHIGRSVVKVGE